MNNEKRSLGKIAWFVYAADLVVVAIILYIIFLQPQRLYECSYTCMGEDIPTDCEWLKSHHANKTLAPQLTIEYENDTPTFKLG